MSVFLCVRPSEPIPRNLLVIIVKIGTVTASDMGMHHILIELTFTFIQGYIDQNHENNKCSIISEFIQTMPMRVCCEDSPTKALYDHSQSDDLFTQVTTASQM